MGSGSRRSLRVSARPMPMIVEDESLPPSIPARSNQRMAPQYLQHGSYPSFSSSPPLTRSSDSGSWPDRKPEERREGIRDQAWIARRGGWYRLILLSLLTIAVVIGLAVGLTLRLRNKKKSTSPSLPPPFFPEGSWSFTTALRNVSTSCTRNPGTFRCYPYSTYSSSSPELSSATYHWVITVDSDYQYLISSSSNPFAPEFSNITLALHEVNQPTEHFTFNTTMTKPVVPTSGTFPASDGATTCYFNSTVLSATIWTQLRADYPRNITSVPAPANASTTFDTWPFAVEVVETQRAGDGVPDCRDWQGRAVGDVSVGDGAGACSCSYSNYLGLWTGNGTDSQTSGRRRRENET